MPTPLEEEMMKKALLVVAALALPVTAHARHSFLAFLSGYEEVPSVSTAAEGVFQARSSDDGLTFEYALSYEGLQGSITQAHIHFASRHVNGPIVVWLCGTPTNPGPAGTPPCPASGTVRGAIGFAQVLAAPAAQQLAAGEIQEVLRAMRNGAAYVNVHTTISPGGEIRGQIRPW